MSVVLRRVLPILVAALLALPVLAVPAFAHEERSAGPYKMTWGLGNEEVSAGDKTFFEADITQDGKPVVFTEAETKLLAVHVFVGAVKTSPELAAKQPGGKPFALTMRAVPWCAGCGPGHYQTEDFRFSTAGPYTAHLHTPIAGVAGATKTVKLRGQVIDEQFPMGEGKYGPVHDPTERMWPTKVPTTAQLATLLERGNARQAAVQTAAVAKADQTADDVSRLQTTVVILAIALVLAVVVGVAFALSARSRRSRSQATDRPAQTPSY